MSTAEQIGRLLAARFAGYDGTKHGRGRVVFWHDEHGEFADLPDEICGPDAAEKTLRDVEVIRPERNPFAVKYRILLEEPTTKFLVYTRGSRPAAADNWLLDLELAYGPGFTADRLTMILNEVLPQAADEDRRGKWLHIMKEHKAFFEDDDRVAALAARLRPTDDGIDFQAKMVATLLGLNEGEHSMQAIWWHLLCEYADGDAEGRDDGNTAGLARIAAMGLDGYHWKGTRDIYRFDTARRLDHPTVKDFVLWLFRLAWNGFADDHNGPDHYANIRRDFDTWRNNVRLTPVMRRLAEDAYPDLTLDASIVAMGPSELAERDLFRETDEQLVSLLAEAIGNGTIRDEETQRIIASRRYGLWYDDFAKDYAFIAAASALRAAMRASEPVIEAISSPRDGFRAYADTLHRVDGRHRHFAAAWKASGRADYKAIADDLELEHLRWQTDLGVRWQAQVATMDRWAIEDIPPMAGFHRRNVETVTKAGRKIVVIISDALRYEVAAEFAERLNTQSRWTATIEAQLGALPSYTQLGMAALLPHRSLAWDPADHYHVLADGRPTGGLEPRKAVLAASGGDAVKADDLLRMKRDECRDRVKSCNVLYVYHNVIDKIGDAADDVAGVPDACERAINELNDIVKRLASANVTNMIVTADHGFLYQGHDVEGTEWLSERPSGDAIWQLKPRFVIGSDLVDKPAFTTFTAAQVGMDDPDGEGVTVQLANGIHRLSKQGAGVRYVHGGAALQEIVVPVVHINKGRSASGDARPVGIRILQSVPRITTGQISVDFFQEEPVGGKMHGRAVLAGLWGVGPDGKATLISNEETLRFDSGSAEASERHVVATFVLTGDASRFNNTMVELRLSEPIPGSGQTRPLDKGAEYLLKRGFADDDGFDFL